MLCNWSEHIKSSIKKKRTCPGRERNKENLSREREKEDNNIKGKKDYWATVAAAAEAEAPASCADLYSIISVLYLSTSLTPLSW